MADKVSIECPACAARLNLADRTKLGKKIKCPKCSEVFVAEAPDEDELIEDDDDDYDDDKPKQPSSRKRGATDSSKGSVKGSKKGAAKGKSSEGSSNLPLILGGVLGLLALVGGGLFFAGVFNSKPLPTAPNNTPAPMAAAPVQAPTPPPPQISPAEKVLGLRWMPPETDLLVHAKLADIWQAPLLKEALNSPSATLGLKEFEQQFGLLPADIESISVGIDNLMGTFMKSYFAAKKTGVLVNFAQTPPQDIHYVVVIKTKKPFDLKQLSQSVADAKLQEKNGKTYFEVPAKPPLTLASGGWSPDSTTLILATQKELIATIERGETFTPRKEFLTVDHLPQLIIANAFPIKSTIDNIKKTADDELTELPGIVVNSLQANEKFAFQLGSFGLSVKGGFDLQISTLSSTDDGAKNIKAELEKQIGDLRTLFEGYKKTAPPLIAELGDMLLTNLKVEEQNQTVKIATSVPDSAQDKLEQLPPIVMMMAMTGGMAGGFGGPPGAVPPGFGASPGSFPTLPSTTAEALLKLPGESAPVEAASVEGLPEGMTLSARTAWKTNTAVTGPDGTTVPADSNTSTIEVLFDFRGDGLDSICGATGVTSKTVKLEGGASVKKSKLTLPGGIDPQKTFLPFDLENVLPNEHPPETLRVRLQLELPATPGTKIALLEGSFKYLTAENSQELSVDNVPQTAKQPLKGPEFKAGGVKLIRGPKDATPETLRLECGKDHFLGRVRGTPGDITSLTEVEKGATIQRIYANQPQGKFPDDFQIQFKLHSQIKEHTVTFRFEDIPLPTPESKPGAPQQSTGPQ